MMKKYILLAVLSCLAIANAQELIVEREKKENWRGKVEFAPQYERGKGPCFVLYGKYPTALIYNKYIPVDSSKTYTYKVSLRTLDEKLPASGYIGFYLYDAQKRSILFRNVYPLKNSSSEVVSAKKGDKFLIIRKIENFARFKKFSIVFNAKDDFSDIPNFDILANCTKIVDNGDGNLRVELKSALKKDYPAGTPTRLHSPYGPPMYNLASGWMPSGEGRECVAVLKGVHDTPGTAKIKFWKGTKYVRPFVWFGNWNRKPEAGAKLLVDGMSLVVSD